MANIVQIDYLYRDQGKLTDFIQKVALTDVTCEWDAVNCKIKIIWQWGQESQVKELLNLIRERFKEPAITIDNEEYNNNVAPLTTLSDEEQINPTNPERIHIPTEEMANQALDVPKTTEALMEEEPKEEIHEEAVVPNEENVPTSFIESTAPTCITPLEKAKEVEEDNEPATPSKEEYEKALKELLKEAISEYDFYSNPEKAALNFCSDYQIKSDVIRYALALVKKVPNEAQLIQGLARLTNNNNRAMVKVTLNGNFKRWIKSKYPAFAEEYPDVNVVHFLNLFRDETHKF